MTVFDRLERRCGWLAFPGFLRYYALFHVLVFILQLVLPDIRLALEFDRAKILSGEVWRLVTMFFAHSEFGNPRSVMSLIFLFFAVNFVFMVSDGLEEAWGSFKASLFYYTGILTVLVANFVYSVAVPFSGTVLYASAFLAFCTIFPRMQIMLFFILPVQVRFLGMLMAAGFLLAAISSPILLPFFLVAFSNYFIWAGVPALRGTVAVLEAGKRKKAFSSGKRAASEAFHTCAACGRTELSDPQLEFRIGRDGEEYCVEHLPPEHVVE